jgi:hypothetical protein
MKKLKKDSWHWRFFTHSCWFFCGRDERGRISTPDEPISLCLYCQTMFWCAVLTVVFCIPIGIEFLARKFLLWHDGKLPYRWHGYEQSGLSDVGRGLHVAALVAGSGFVYGCVLFLLWQFGEWLGEWWASGWLFVVVPSAVLVIGFLALVAVSHDRVESHPLKATEAEHLFWGWVSSLKGRVCPLLEFEDDKVEV